MTGVHVHLTQFFEFIVLVVVVVILIRVSKNST